MTPVPSDHGQMSVEEQPDFRDEIMPHNGNSLDDEYIDYSCSSDTGDEDSDGSDADDNIDDNANGPDHPDMDPNFNNEGRNPRHLDEAEGTQPHKDLWVEQTIFHFPGRRAGEVCSKGIMSMQEYENALGGQSENPYSPFASKIDWELAKWAKLRGPSATSFTELLNIGGVSPIHRS